MRDDLRPGNKFPDIELPNQDKEAVKLSSLMRGFPTVVLFSRGYYCPKDRRQLANYVEHLQPELIVNYCKLVVVSVDSPVLSKEIRDGLGATFPFLSDEEKRVITELDIVDSSDSVHSPVAIPYTFVLDRDRTIYKIYNGWWFVGRPTVEELRMDYRALLSRRQDWWYDKTPPPYTE
ncbi:MAG: redoxin domain-containing protein [Acidobacteria bacterium]|nr:redoxin domain-containing protein [Acidobacteriota bacterium]